MKPDLYAVVGNPIAHSKSPIIHQQFALQTGENIKYTKLLAPLEQFEQTISAFFEQGGKGLNITVPFKLLAYEFAEQKNERAQFAQAANTLIKDKNGTLICDNTDGVGIVRDIQQNQQLLLKNKKILVLGAGGAVQGVLQPILQTQPSLLHIANRTASKAENLAKQFSALGNVTASSLETIPNELFDIIINGTAASLQASVPNISPSLIHKKCFCYDMMYAKQGTAFTQWAIQNGAKKVSDGLGMLVEQAAESFYLWRGVMPKTQAVMALIRSL